MTGTVLLDTGPLVAHLDRSDHFHEWARSYFQRLASPLLICEPVLTEALFLLRRVPGGAAAVMSLLKCDSVRLAFHLNTEHESVAALLTRYANVPMSLADASLVRMAELNDRAAIFTLDGDFKIYRKHGRKIISLILPTDGRRSAV